MLARPAITPPTSSTMAATSAPRPARVLRRGDRLSTSRCGARQIAVPRHSRPKPNHTQLMSGFTYTRKLATLLSDSKPVRMMYTSSSILWCIDTSVVGWSLLAKCHLAGVSVSSFLPPSYSDTWAVTAVLFSVVSVWSWSYTNVYSRTWNASPGADTVKSFMVSNDLPARPTNISATARWTM